MLKLRGFLEKKLRIYKMTEYQLENNLILKIPTEIKTKLSAEYCYKTL